MALNTYLTFDGNCREAFEFYRSVFGGEFAEFQTFGDGPPDMPISDAEKDRVMHVALPIGSSVLMGSDSSSFGPPLAVGNNFSLSIDAESRERCDELFAKLSAGGVGHHAAAGPVLGVVLRSVRRPVRRQLDGEPHGADRIDTRQAHFALLPFRRSRCRPRHRGPAPRSRFSRIRNFCTFPVTVIGKASTSFQ